MITRHGAVSLSLVSEQLKSEGPFPQLEQVISLARKVLYASETDIVRCTEVALVFTFFSREDDGGYLRIDVVAVDVDM